MEVIHLARIKVQEDTYQSKMARNETTSPTDMAVVLLTATFSELVAAGKNGILRSETGFRLPPMIELFVSSCHPLFLQITSTPSNIVGIPHGGTPHPPHHPITPYSLYSTTPRSITPALLVHSDNLSSILHCRLCIFGSRALFSPR